MDDRSIVALFWARNENALDEVAGKYGRYCHSIAYGILSSHEDAEEAVNDTWLGAWEAMPPHQPEILSTFLGKITRRVSLKRWRDHHAQKRGGGEVPLALEELLECIPDGHAIDGRLNAEELGRMIGAFLSRLPALERRVFIRRYWSLVPISQLCAQFGCGRSKLESMLHRTREKLRSYLKKEGVIE